MGNRDGSRRKEGTTASSGGRGGSKSGSTGSTGDSDGAGASTPIRYAWIRNDTIIDTMVLFATAIVDHICNNHHIITLTLLPSPI